MNVHRFDRSIPWLVVALTCSDWCAAQGPAAMVKDINATPAYLATNPDPTGLTASAAGFAVFAADLASVGRELWRTDYTTGGTALLADLNPGGSSSPSDFYSAGGLIYFTADTAAGRELWRTDGTVSGTFMVLDILPGAGSAAPQGMIALAGAVYFVADDGVHGRELWRTDGTASGTRLVADVYPGLSSSSPTDLVVYASALFFAANDGVRGRELWRSDGVTATLAGDLVAGPQSSAPQGLVSVATTIGTRLFFSASSTVTGREPVLSDGTVAGTVVLRDIVTGTGSSTPAFFGLAAASRTFLFTAHSTANGRELWRSDGTTAGTVLVRDINPGTADAAIGPASSRITVGGTPVLLFAANDATSGAELWRTDGTAAGTVLVADIRSGVMGSNPANFRSGNGILFTATTVLGGTELWRTDGITATIVKDIWPGADSSLPSELIAAGAAGVLFAANDGTHNRQLWQTNGTDVGTVMVSQIYSQTLSANPAGLFALGNVACFRAADGTAGGNGLWRSDGTAAGTYLLVPGFTMSTWLMQVGDRAFFMASTSAAGTELWVTDGTMGGTALVKDINPGSASSSITDGCAFGSRLLFVTSTAAEGQELWVSDGTGAGTVLVKDIVPGSGSSTPGGLAASGGRAFFSADDGSNGREPWVTDGTTLGTRMVADIAPGSGSSNAHSFTWLRPDCYFAARDGSSWAMWRSNGIGVTRVGGQSAVAIQVLGVWSDNIVFIDERQFARELNILPKDLYVSALPANWRVDGIVPLDGGFVLRYRDTNVAFAGPTPVIVYDHDYGNNGLGQASVLLNGAVYDLYTSFYWTAPTLLTGPFVGRDGDTIVFFGGYRLRGGAAGATGVHAHSFSRPPVAFPPVNLQPPVFSDFVTLVYQGASRFLFQSQATSGQMWRSDGLSSAAHAAGSQPSSAVLAGNRLFFASYDPVHGNELWSMTTMSQVIPFGDGCVGSNGAAPRLSVRGGPVLGTTMQIRLRRALPQTLAFVAVGLAKTELPISASCSIWIDPAQIVFAPAMVTDGNGGGVIPLAVPADPSWLHGRIYLQGIALDLGVPPLGASLTGGLELLLSDT